MEFEIWVLQQIFWDLFKRNSSAVWSVILWLLSSAGWRYHVISHGFVLGEHCWLIWLLWKQMNQWKLLKLPLPNCPGVWLHIHVLIPWCEAGHMNVLVCDILGLGAWSPPCKSQTWNSPRCWFLFGFYVCLLLTFCELQDWSSVEDLPYLLLFNISFPCLSAEGNSGKSLTQPSFPFAPVFIVVKIHLRGQWWGWPHLLHQVRHRAWSNVCCHFHAVALTAMKLFGVIISLLCNLSNPSE